MSKNLIHSLDKLQRLIIMDRDDAILSYVKSDFAQLIPQLKEYLETARDLGADVERLRAESLVRQLECSRAINRIAESLKAIERVVYP